MMKRSVRWGAVLLALALVGLVAGGCRNDPIKTTRNAAHAPGNAVKYLFPTGNPHLLMRLIDCHWVPPTPGHTCGTEGLSLDEVQGDAVYASIEIDDAITGCEPVVKLTPRTTVQGGDATEQDSYYTLLRMETNAYLGAQMGSNRHWGNAPSSSAVSVDNPSGHLTDLKNTHNIARDDLVTTVKLMIKSYPQSQLAKICQVKK